MLRFLFKRNEAEAPPRRARPEATPPRRNTPKQRRSQPSQATPQPPKPAVEKEDDARRVLVVGDFLAGGAADGLAAAFAEDSSVKIVDRSNGSSGLVRDDFYDWPASIGPLIDQDEPVAVVVMVGSNDRQQMRVGDNREQPGSDAWNAEYQRRVEVLAKAIRERDLPLLWIGNLPFKSSAMSSDMVAFNDIYRRVVTDLGGEFIDVWDGFVDETGAFVTNGPDMNGQPAQLRAGDGINVTRDGRRKIAFYVEKPLKRLFGAEDPEAPLAPGEFQGPMPEEIPPAQIVRTAPLGIDDPEMDGGSELLGASFPPKAGVAETPVERLTLEGIAPDAQPGRADDFYRRSPAVPASDASETIDSAKTTALDR